VKGLALGNFIKEFEDGPLRRRLRAIAWSRVAMIPVFCVERRSVRSGKSLTKEHTVGDCVWRRTREAGRQPVYSRNHVERRPVCVPLIC